ncbi:MFS transporter [Streptomyces sp. SID13031]|uniref:MFS transporter n=1 Tax=Streptomyces sp. SID13031 TaxID=2706046 RepID=UPI0013CB9CF1|nr:MFS transporter [Streptomyces sp. SID13031]NEA30343.1 MFS transporter [Streptomyces sp. SID13031]
MARRPADPATTDPADRPATYRDVFAVAEFRWLWAALVGSVIGDQLARVALAVLVFDRTGSAGLSALTYALTFLPDIAGGPLLGGLADRYPRRRLVVGCDLARAALVAMMAIPGAPLWVLCVLLVVVQLLAAPFQSARSALLATIMTGDKYKAATGLSVVTGQGAQLIGFVSGGTLVAALGASQALALNAASFALSAVLLQLGVKERPVPTWDGPTARPSWWGSLAAGARLVWGNRKLRYLTALVCVPGFYITVEGLAVPYAATVGGGAAAAGVLFAANPAGQVVGILLFSRMAPSKRLTILGPLAIGTCVPLMACVFSPGLWVTVALWALSGLSAAYLPTAQATFVQDIPDAQRGQAIGLARTALIVSQGIGVLAAGVAADSVQPSLVVAAAGVLGVLFAVGAARGYQRAVAA